MKNLWIILGVLSSLFTKDLYESNQSQNNEIASLFQDSFVDLKNDVNKKRIPKNKNANKVFDIGEKILTLINNKN